MEASPRRANLCIQGRTVYQMQSLPDTAGRRVRGVAAAVALASAANVEQVRIDTRIGDLARARSGRQIPEGFGYAGYVRDGVRVGIGIERARQRARIEAIVQAIYPVRLGASLVSLRGNNGLDERFDRVGARRISCQSSFEIFGQPVEELRVRRGIAHRGVVDRLDDATPHEAGPHAVGDRAREIPVVS